MRLFLFVKLQGAGVRDVLCPEGEGVLVLAVSPGSPRESQGVKMTAALLADFYLGSLPKPLKSFIFSLHSPILSVYYCVNVSYYVRGYTGLSQ